MQSIAFWLWFGHASRTAAESINNNIIIFSGHRNIYTFWILDKYWSVMLCKLPRVIFIIILLYTPHIPVDDGPEMDFAFITNFSTNGRESNILVRWSGDKYFSLITERISIFSGFEKVIFGVSFENIFFVCFGSSQGSESIFRSFGSQIFFYIFIVSLQ